jgi:CRISPR-associated protein Csx16
MSTYLVTRHQGAIDWLTSKGVKVDGVLAHIESEDDFSPGDVVIGILPVNLIAKLNQKGVRTIVLSLTMPAHLRGQELNMEGMEACEPRLDEYLSMARPVDFASLSDLG